MYQYVRNMGLIPTAGWVLLGWGSYPPPYKGIPTYIVSEFVYIYMHTAHTAAHPATHYCTAAHCHTAKHALPHCRTLPCALPYTTKHTAPHRCTQCTHTSVCTATHTAACTARSAARILYIHTYSYEYIKRIHIYNSHKSILNPINSSKFT
jgi:hypothetical protein